MKLHFALSGLLIGTLAFIAIYHWLPASPVSAPTVQVSQAYAGQPTSLDIPNLDIHTPIQTGQFDQVNQTWDITDQSAYYAAVTPLPNDFQGTTVMYGHNSNTIFGKTADLQPGDTLSISTENGRTFNYRYVSRVTVDPDQVDVMYQSTGQPQIVLITCSGLFNQHRELMTFEFVSVQTGALSSTK